MIVVAVVTSVGQTGHVGVVEVDVCRFRRLVVGVVVSVVMMVVVAMVVGLGHGVGSRQASHRLLHVGVVRRGLHLQGSLRGVGLVAVRARMAAVHEVVPKESAVAL